MPTLNCRGEGLVKATMETGLKALVLLSVLLGTLSVAGCATTAGYKRVCDSWMGSNVNTLITAWGPPSDTYTMPNGQVMYTWLNVGGTRVFSNYNQYLNMVTSNEVTYWCKTTMTANSEGTIISWRFEGNSCIHD